MLQLWTANLKPNYFHFKVFSSSHQKEIDVLCFPFRLLLKPDCTTVQTYWLRFLKIWSFNPSQLTLLILGEKNLYKFHKFYFLWQRNNVWIILTKGLQKTDTELWSMCLTPFISLSFCWVLCSQKGVNKIVVVLCSQWVERENKSWELLKDQKEGMIQSSPRLYHSYSFFFTRRNIYVPVYRISHIH